MKKALSLITSLILCMGLFSACVGNNAAGNASAAPSTSTAVKGDAANAPKDNGETVELVMVFPSPASAPGSLAEVQDAINNITRDEIGVTVKLMPLEWGVYSDQTNLMLTGSERLDLLFTMGTVSTYKSRGQVLAISEYLDQYGADVQALLGDYLDACLIDGQLYGFPPLHDFAVQAGLVCRTDILEALNVDVSAIKSYKDVEPVFEKVKVSYPDLHVLVPRTIQRGILYDRVLDKYDILFSETGPGGIPFGGNDTTVVNTYATDEYMQIAKMANEWYRKGYIMTDATTNTETRETLVKNDKAFGFIASVQPGINVDAEMDTGKPMTAIPLDDTIITTNGISNFQWVVPRNCQYPEKAVQFYNIMFTNKEIQNLLNYGIEGKDFEVKEGNIIGYPEGVNISNTGWPLNMTWYSGNAFIGYVWEGKPATIWEEMQKWNDSAIRSPAYGFLYSAENVKNEVAAVVNVISKYDILLTTGVVNPETEIPKFLAELEAAGNAKIMADKQSQLDAWLATQK